MSEIKQKPLPYIMEHNCKWKQNLEGDWDTDCGEEICTEGEKPRAMRFVWCPYCGGKIKQRSR